MENTSKYAKRGFGSMDKERHRLIASKGGKRVQELGTGHRFTSEEARAAGKKGGLSTGKNTLHMSEIGRKGGTISRK